MKMLTHCIVGQNRGSCFNVLQAHLTPLEEFAYEKAAVGLFHNFYSESECLERKSTVQFNRSFKKNNLHFSAKVTLYPY